MGDLRADLGHMARQEQQIADLVIGLHRAIIGAVIADLVKIGDIQTHVMGDQFGRHGISYIILMTSLPTASI